MTAYYNEINKYAAQHLRNLIEAGHIAPGFVDERSIVDVKPDELLGYTQCHFFAGVGVWSYALRRAGWPDDKPVWTGSCPCQPFSTAGKGNGFDDERHLWPHFQWLIQQCRPAEILGEQVASKDADAWIDLVHADMEAMGYAFGCVPFPSASVGAPHIRDRAYWVANTEKLPQRALNGECLPAESGLQEIGTENISWIGRLGNSNSEPARRNAGAAHSEKASDGPISCDSDRFGDAGEILHAGKPAAGPTNGPWQSADWLFCQDGKWRPVEPGTFPLVNGAAGRVGRVRADWRTPAGKEGSGHRSGRLKGYGNAINAYQAQIFIEAYLGN